MINYDLKRIKAVIFDVDGVLSASTITLSTEGEPLRTANIKDGYAIQLANKMGLHVAIITGGNTRAVQEIIYVGDDIPDYEIMKVVGCPCCPKDACSEIQALSLYISDYKGGMGCGRDILEQVLKAQGKWMSNAKAFGW